MTDGGKRALGFFLMLIVVVGAACYLLEQPLAYLFGHILKF